ncbi:type II toxin-antitoxin system HicB family antitoxin [Nitrosomonas marina]|uniref:type II toxin-antitoxin system HicB family antitoxin n=1 Tax=Nitrosomonas marina TaxID=917 RepID=UPI0015A5AF72|nr:type II toxin-antitoxin system HicB family antitoxin [Nitrosomonas marina]
MGVIVPDLPGYFSASDNEADILNNAHEAITLHFESLDHIPVPSRLSDIDANGLITRQVEVELP